MPHKLKKFFKSLKKIQAKHVFPVVLLAFIGVASFLWFQQRDFSTGDIDLRIEGPEQIDNGTEEFFTIVLENGSQRTISDFSWRVDFPESVDLVTGKEELDEAFDEIGPEETREIEFSLIAYSERPKEEIRINSSYSPEGLRARFVATASYEIVIGTIDATLFLDLPSTTHPEHNLNGRIYVIPHSDIDMDHLYLRLTIPDNFEIEETSEEFETESSWKLDSLKEGENINKEFVGRLTSTDENPTFRVDIGRLEGFSFLPLASTEETVEISDSPLILNTRLEDPEDGIVKAGDRMLVNISYLNSSNTDLEDALVRTYLSREFVDFDSIENEDIIVNANEGFVEWNSSTSSSLEFIEEGDGGSFELSFNVIDPLEPQHPSDTRRRVNAETVMRSAQEGFVLDSAFLRAQDSVSARIETIVDLEQQMAEYEPEEEENNGEENGENGDPATDNWYTITWTVTNTMNRVTGASVEVKLPEGVEFTKSDDDSIESNGSNVAWNIGTLEVGEEKTIEFTVEVDSDSSVEYILEDVEIKGKDTFTERSIDREIDSLEFDQ